MGFIVNLWMLEKSDYPIQRQGKINSEKELENYVLDVLKRESKAVSDFKTEMLRHLTF